MLLKLIRENVKMSYPTRVYKSEFLVWKLKYGYLAIKVRNELVKASVLGFVNMGFVIVE